MKKLVCSSWFFLSVNKKVIKVISIPIPLARMNLGQEIALKGRWQDSESQGYHAGRRPAEAEIDIQQVELENLTDAF